MAFKGGWEAFLLLFYMPKSRCSYDIFVVLFLANLLKKNKNVENRPWADHHLGRPFMTHSPRMSPFIELTDLLH